MLAPPRPPAHDDLEALIREARARQRRRWIGAAALVAVVAGVAVGISSIFGGSHSEVTSDAGQRSATVTVSRCGIRVEGIRIFQGGRTVYRAPGHYVNPNGGPGAQVQCSGATIWVVWELGAGMSKGDYVGARSADRGHTWRLVISQPFFGVKAPHALDAYLDIWTLRGPQDAYFAGSCPACGIGTTSLWVTTDGGRSFVRYAVPWPKGQRSASVRIPGHTVTISARGIRVS